MAAVSAALVADPAVARLPLHAPLAVHAVALRDDHVSTVVAPFATLVGLAEIETVGGGVEASETVADWLLDPPAPLQVSVNADVRLIALVTSVPLSALLPLQFPEAVQVVAFVEVHVSVEVLPGATVVGDADKETIGAGVVPAGVTVTMVDD